MKVTAIIPTRGDVPLGRIADRLREYPEIQEIRFVIGSTPLNRYKTILEIPGTGDEIYYTQDDDCLTNIGPLLDAYNPAVITNAMTPEHAKRYEGHQTLIGFGAVFSRELVRHAFHDFPWDRDDVFFRESDRIFPTVNPHNTVYPLIEILPWANAENRLWKQPDHLAARDEMNRRIFMTTGVVA